MKFIMFARYLAILPLFRLRQQERHCTLTYAWRPVWKSQAVPVCCPTHPHLFHLRQEMHQIGVGCHKNLHRQAAVPPSMAHLHAAKTLGCRCCLEDITLAIVATGVRSEMVWVRFGAKLLTCLREKTDIFSFFLEIFFFSLYTKKNSPLSQTANLLKFGFMIFLIIIIHFNEFLFNLSQPITHLPPPPAS